MAPTKNPYEVLRLSPTASQQDIDDAYGRLKGLLADNALASYGMMDPEQAVALAHELDSAYSAIGQADSRVAFDQGQHPWAIEAALGHDVSTSPQQQGHGVGVSESHVPQGDASKPLDPMPDDRKHATALDHRLLPTKPFHVPDEALAEATAPLDGALLQRLRLAAGASLDDVSDLTKINRRYLAAIENDDFAQLPAGVYVRGFVSEYLRALSLVGREGFDSKALMASFIERYQSWRRKS